MTTPQTQGTDPGALAAMPLEHLRRLINTGDKAAAREWMRRVHEQRPK